MLAKGKILQILLSVLLAVIAMPSDGFGSEITYQDRLEAQRIIERIYFINRQESSPTSSNHQSLFSEIVTDKVVQEKVEGYLLKSHLLDIYWSRPVTGEQIQAELNRVIIETRDPVLLEQLFASLDFDPRRIAECLIRPVLVDRLIRNWYSGDKRFHVSRRETIQILRDQKRFYLPGSAGHEFYNPVTLEIREHTSASQLNGSMRYCSQDEFEGLVDKFPPQPSLSPVEETIDSFILRITHTRTDDYFDGGILRVPKVSFDSWFGTEKSRNRLKNGSLQFSESNYPYSLDLYQAREQHKTSPESPDSWEPVWFVPEYRSGHTTIWTGTEMIIWGGKNDTVLNTGGRYIPATDSWTPMTLTDCPQARSAHTAVWSGTDLIVFGGKTDNGTALGSGAHYSPALDTWTAISSVNSPSSRFSQSAIWNGSSMIIWGGQSDASTYLDDGGIYNPSTDSWSVTGTINAPAPRSGHSALWAGTVMIVWGGNDETVELDSGGSYTPATGEWTILGKSISFEPDNVPVVLPGRGTLDSLLTIVNDWGLVNAVTVQIWIDHAFAEELDIYLVHPDGTRIELSTDNGGQAADYDGTIFDDNAPTPIIGGLAPFAGSYRPEQPLAGLHGKPVSGVWNLEVTDDTNQTVGLLADWKLHLETTGLARTDHSAIWTGTHMIIWGGLPVTNTGARYAPGSNTWTETAAVDQPAARTRHSVAWTGSRMVIWGGFDGSSALNSGSVYLPGADIWSTHCSRL